MSTFKKAKVVMITTDKFTLTTLCKCIRVNGLLMDALKLNRLSKPLTEEELEDANHGKDVIGIDRYFEAQHLYILSDDEIKENNTHFYNPHSGQLHISGNHTDYEAINKNGCKKIIATTDSSLRTIKCECLATTFEGCSQCIEILPQPSQQFIEKYIEEYNKGNIITDVLVECEQKSKGFVNALKGNYNYENILKINPDNTITIKKVKDNYTREEILNDIEQSIIQGLNIGQYRDKWIEENL